MTDNHAYHSIEDMGGQWDPLGDTPKPLEGVPVVSAHHFHRGFPIPIAGQETADLGDHPLSFQYIQVAPLFQRIISLVYINKYFIQDLLLHACNLLECFGLQCGCPSPSSHSEHV